VTIVDSSTWINHFHRPNPELVGLMEEEDVCVHPFVLGEIACGHVRQRQEVLEELRSQFPAPPSDSEDVLQLIEHMSLHGRGLNFVDTNRSGK